MNPIATGALLGVLMLPVPPFLPGPSSVEPPVAHDAAAPRAPGAVWPLAPAPEVVRGFDPPSEAWSAGHRGVDLLGVPGEPVRAALSGTVSFAGTIAGRGVVVIEHGGFRTTYEPVHAAVRRGEEVSTGAVIGTLQAGLSHCAPRACLHWGLIGHDGYQDPLSLVRGRRVRLLPWMPDSVLRPEDEPGGRPDGAARW